VIYFPSFIPSHSKKPRKKTRKYFFKSHIFLFFCVIWIKNNNDFILLYIVYSNKHYWFVLKERKTKEIFRVKRETFEEIIFSSILSPEFWNTQKNTQRKRKKRDKQLFEILQYSSVYIPRRYLSAVVPCAKKLPIETTTKNTQKKIFFLKKKTFKFRSLNISSIELKHHDDDTVFWYEKNFHLLIEQRVIEN
jgi:hypothetical protein